MRFTGERFVPGEVSGEIGIEHFSRYYAISHISEGKRVLDLACGDGYGSFHLSETAQSVLGVDIDTQSILRAKEKYQRQNLDYREGDATNIPAGDSTFDVVVSFETIEHITGEQQQAFLREIQRVLQPDGLLLMSTPDKKFYSDIPNYHNKYHVKEFYVEDFDTFLRQAFAEVIFLRHGIVKIGKQITGILSLPEKPLPFSNFSVDVRQLPYIVAVCANHDIGDVAASMCQIYVAPPDDAVSVDFFFDQGNGFTHSNKLMKSLKPKENVYHVRWEWDKTNEESIRQIKFDPNNTACCFHLLKMETNIDNVSLEYPNAKLTNGVYYFHDMDPGIIIGGSIPAEGFIDIAYEMKALDVVDLVHLLTEQELIVTELSNSLAQWMEMHYSLSILSAHLSEIQSSLDERDHQINNVQAGLDDRIHQINDICASLDKLNQYFNNMQLSLDDRDRQLSDIRSSHAWALMQQLWKVRDWVIPLNSRRRLLAKLAYKTVRSPRLMMDKLTTENVRKLWHYMRTESPAEVEARLALHVPTSASFSSQLALLPLRTSLPESLADYEPLAFPVFDGVTVSIVIPVYNQFDYTYNCLCTILRHTKDVSYEIILADDVSTDFTKNIEDIISHITVLHNTQNLGFLQNCNAAATKAKGKYIFFLNNDTQVQPGWLPPLVKILDEHADIGMTGSKLVYPDGRLQEAGGIFWWDGSAWNYGHGEDPDAPEFNYVKDVDYISGAAIMIRRELWEDIGGFDERFVPAYCEDADLAFAVRQKGYRVVYQPLSVVVHFEGVSNGRDVKKGVKRYQVENQQKFYEKWKNVLEEENFPSGEEVFWARDRSRTKKTILVIDHYVPQWDQDAGSRTTYSYLRLWLRMGLHVLFVGDNYARLEPYATVLQQMGVEVLAGNHWSMTRFREWIKKNGRYLDYILLNRPHIAIKYIGCLRKETKAKIIYYGHDLHFLREQRQYETEKNPALLQSAAEWKEKEQALFTKADIIYAPGAYEKHVIQAMVPDKRVQAIPIYLYDKKEFSSYAASDVKGRDGLLFVGGFRHQPNADSIRWFIEEIHPMILDKCPMVRMYIVGSNPTPYIQSLASERIVVTGYVSDEELERLYKTCRVVVSPLRFGAGVKGKIVEAMRYGVPLVTTPVGAEGLPKADSCMAIADVGDAAAFAVKTLRLLEDDEAWRKQSVQEISYMKQYFTYEYATSLLMNDFE